MIDKAKLLDVLDTGLRRALPVVRAAERVAPLVGPSRALAGVTAVVGMLADWRKVECAEPADPESLDGDCRAIDAILRAASMAGVGRVVGEPHPGHQVREHEGCRWGITDHWRFGPHGDPAPLLRAVWEHVGPAISVLRLRERGDRIQLRRDTLGAALSSPRAAQIAAEALALRRCGEPVGVLLSGPPGTGKSVAARWVAHELGGRSIRASLDDIDFSLMEAFVRHLQPTAVLLDDIDRGGTSHALDVAEGLTAAGVAVVATCNDAGALDPALLRARRLGLHYTIEQVEPVVLDGVLAGLDVPADVRALLENAPVALARDYAGHHRALGPDRALALLRGRVGTPSPGGSST